MNTVPEVTAVSRRGGGYAFQGGIERLPLSGYKVARGLLDELLDTTVVPLHRGGVSVVRKI